MPVKTDVCLRLHVADGVVWAAEGRELPFSTGRKVEQLAQWLPTESTVRIVGAPENLELICQAWNWKLAGRVTKVELVSPGVCGRARDREDPAKLLYQTRNPLLAPSQGGAHEMLPAAAEIYLYALAPNALSAYQFGQTRLGHALTFVSGCDLVRCLQIVARAIDPRWFVDTSRPDRTSKLEGFFGLHPKTQNGVLGFGRPWGRHAECLLVQQAWAGGFSPTYPPESFLPGEFVRRKFWDHWLTVDDRDRALVKSYLRASQRFLRYLRFVWLDAIYAGSAALPDGRAGLFRAEDLFDTPGEALAYRQHMSDFSR